MKLQSIVCLVAMIASAADAFTGSSQVSPRRALISSRKPTAIRAAASDGEKKKTTKKKAAKAVKGDADEVVTFRKPEFIASIAEKTGMSKADSEAALAAVLETISEVSSSVVIISLQ